MSLFGLFGKSDKNNIQAPFKVGQEWQYQTRPHEENSRVKIAKIENYEEIGKIVHIAVSRVKIKNPKYPKGLLEEVMHLPVSEDALKNSITKLETEHADLPAYEQGYVRWKSAFDEKKAGYFGIPLREILQWLEDGTYEVKG